MAASTPKPIDSKRRRFQPPITTFFTPSSGANTPSTPSHLSYTHYAAITNSPTPVIPAQVQASLLSVGMRVRKSIADGYKTNLAKAEKQISLGDNASSMQARATITPSSTTRSELAPFCGMSKSNEYSTTLQPLPHPTTYSHHHHEHNCNKIITTDEDNDAFSLPPSSQESIDSELDRPITVPSRRKRTHYDFDFDPYEDDMDGADVDDDFMSGWQDPLRLHSVTDTTTTGRAILSPTLNTQRRRVIAAQKFTGGQSTMDLDDFEEPAFLRRREEVDMDVDC
ncbi:hypothetical protein BDV06DRAFT_193832 [Aspergillus oleicola]